MRDLAPTLRRWISEGRPFAVATVVRTWGSSPRPIGASMAVDTESNVVGSVSGGCVEGAVVAAALSAMEASVPAYLEFESVSDADAWQVGLPCGGAIEVWVEPNPDVEAALEAIEAGEPIVRRIARGDGNLDAAATIALSERRSLLADGGFVQFIGRAPQLLIIGASHIALPLVSMARTLGFRTTVVDSRAVFLRPDRFEVAPDLTIAEPPERALRSIVLHDEVAAVCLSHDPKFDLPALRLLLRSEVGYVGLLGSRATQAARREVLRAEGFTDGELRRIRGPVGLDLGARSPEEIALSIVAEIVAIRNGRGC